MITPGPKGIHLTCLCGTIRLPSSSLASTAFPTSSTICHCNPCRYTSGTLHPTFASLSGPPSTLVLQNLTAYQFTPSCIRYFCSRCGCHCFVEHPLVENEWFCAAGIVEVEGNGDAGAKEDVVRISGHAYVKDTVDGGMAPELLAITEGTGERVYAGKYGDGDAMTAQELRALTNAAAEVDEPVEGESVRAKCHCGGVDLMVKRAEYVTEPPGVRRRIDEREPHKYEAKFCACRSCRLSCGFSLQPWFYCSPNAVSISASGAVVVVGQPAMEQGANHGLKLKHYESSKGVYRSFCGACGATVFYYRTGEERPDVLDVSIGLLRAQSGSMAKEWLRWTRGKVSHAEECVDKSQLECILRNGGDE